MYFILKFYVHVIRAEQNSHVSECTAVAGFKQKRRCKAFLKGLYLLPPPSPARLGKRGHGTQHRTSQPEHLESGPRKKVFPPTFHFLLGGRSPLQPTSKGPVTIHCPFSVPPCPLVGRD